MAVIDGVVIPVEVGQTEIVAEAGGVHASAAVRVLGPARLTALSLHQEKHTITLGDQMTLTAKLTYSNGLAVLVRTSPIWRTSDSTVATIDRGVVRGIGPGVAHMIARVGDLEDTLVVEVAASPPAPERSVRGTRTFVARTDRRIPLLPIVEIFGGWHIAKDTVSVPGGVFLHRVLGAPTALRGDSRQPSPLASREQYRAFFRIGIPGGELLDSVVAPSCDISEFCKPPLPSNVIEVQRTLEGGIRLRARLVNSVTRFGDWPSIDAEIVIQPDGRGGYILSGQLESFPSFGLYGRRADGTVEVIFEHMETFPLCLEMCPALNVHIGVRDD